MPRHSRPTILAPADGRKRLIFLGSSRKDLIRLPGPVQDTFGTLLLDVQYGETPREARLLKGFHGAGVLELVEDFDRRTFRLAYTVNLEPIVYVLHVFQKTAKRGIATPRRDLDLVRQRYGLARQHHSTLETENQHG